MKYQVLKLIGRSNNKPMFDPLSLSDFEPIVEDLEADILVSSRTK
jgi:hypothetical protein